jgi:hypothetical protein
MGPEYKGSPPALSRLSITASKGNTLKDKGAGETGLGQAWNPAFL